MRQRPKSPELAGAIARAHRMVLEARIARGRAEIERADNLKPGERHPPGCLGGHGDFYNNYRCALEALRCATHDHKPPRSPHHSDILGQALAMFEDLQHWLAPLEERQQVIAAARRQERQEGEPLQ